MTGSAERMASNLKAVADACGQDADLLITKVDEERLDLRLERVILRGRELTDE